MLAVITAASTSMNDSHKLLLNMMHHWQVTDGCHSNLTCRMGFTLSRAARTNTRETLALHHL